MDDAGNSRTGYNDLMDMTDPQTTRAAPDSAPAPNLFALAAGLTGLIGIFVLPILLGPAAIVMGAVGWVKAGESGTGRGASIVGVALGVLALVAMVAVMNSAPRGY